MTPYITNLQFSDVYHFRFGSPPINLTYLLRAVSSVIDLQMSQTRLTLREKQLKEMLEN